MSYLSELKKAFDIFQDDDIMSIEGNESTEGRNSNEGATATVGQAPSRKPASRGNGQVQFANNTKGTRNNIVAFDVDGDGDGDRVPQAQATSPPNRNITVRTHSARSEISRLTPDIDTMSNANNDGSVSTSSQTGRESKEEIVKKGEGSLAEFRYQCGKFVNHEYAQNFISFIILCNTVLLIVSTYSIIIDNERNKSIVDIVDKVFLGIFTVESALQLIYHDVQIFKNRWHTFDLILVIISWFAQELTVIRCLRVLKIASKFDALQKLINALVDVIPNITAIFSLLMLVFYIFAVMFTTLFKDLELDAADGYFSRLDKSLFSLFQFMTMDWQEAARDTQVHISWSPILFVVFEIVSGFIVFNLIVAVLCEALGLLDKAEGDDEEEIAEDRERLQAIQSLMIQVEEVREKQRKIRKILTEIDGGTSFDEITLDDR